MYAWITDGLIADVIVMIFIFIIPTAYIILYIYRSTALWPNSIIFVKKEIHNKYASRTHACTYVYNIAHTRSPHLYDVYKNNLIRISLPLIHNVILAENVGRNNPDLKGRAAGIQIMPFVEGLINCNLSAVVNKLYTHEKCTFRYSIMFPIEHFNWI